MVERPSNGLTREQIISTLDQQGFEYRPHFFARGATYDAAVGYFATKEGTDLVVDPIETLESQRKDAQRFEAVCIANGYSLKRRDPSFVLAD